jgi:REP element-mobilizing transposase RayT
MSSNYKKKFSDKGLRLQTWDYSWNGKYFVTINTKDKVEYFGEVISEEVHHSAPGKLANEFWEMIPEQFPFAKLDEYIVMPNHVHGIIVIDKSSNSRDATNSGGLSNSGDLSISGDAINRIPTADIPTDIPTADSTTVADVHKNSSVGGFAGKKNPMLYDNLSRVLRWYKGRVTFEIHQARYEFAWQTLFHDRIIRDEMELNRIRQYIRNNPKNWKK